MFAKRLMIVILRNNHTTPPQHPHNTHKIKIGKTRIRVIVLCIGCAFAPQRELNKAVEAHTIISTEFSEIKLTKLN